MVDLLSKLLSKTYSETTQALPRQPIKTKMPPISAPVGTLPIMPVETPLQPTPAPTRTPLPTPSSTPIPESAGYNTTTLGTFPVVDLNKPTTLQPATPLGTAYQFPKVATETVMGAVGGVISHIPVLPKALEFVGPVFTWIHEKLEKPWASIVTSPLSPVLPWKANESWFEHEQREYDTWQSPSYIKGAAEFSMPLWWIPYLGWAGKTAKALGAGAKLTRAIEVGAKVGQFELPTGEILNGLFKENWFRSVAWWAEHKPVLGGIVKTIGGPSAFVHATSDVPVEIAKREAVKWAWMRDFSESVKGFYLPKLLKYRNLKQLLDIDENGIVRAVEDKTGKLGRGISEVIEHPNDFTFKNPQVEAYVKEHREVLKEIQRLAKKEGLDVPEELGYHRMVKGKVGEAGDYEATQYGSKFEVARHYNTMEEAIKANEATVKSGLPLYGNNPIESISATIDYYMRQIANKRFNDVIEPLGKMPKELWATRNIEGAAKLGELQPVIDVLRNGVDQIHNLLTRKGSTIPGATISKIIGTPFKGEARVGVPLDLAERLKTALSLKPQEAVDIIKGLPKSVWDAMGVTEQEVRTFLGQYNAKTGQILLSEFEDTLMTMQRSGKPVLNDTAKNTVMKKVFESALSQGDKTSQLKGILEDMRTTLKTSLDELKPIYKDRSQWLRDYKESAKMGKLGEFESRFTAYRGFGQKVFPVEVVEAAEKILGDKSTQWVRDLGAVGATSRMLTAALDISAPFIQGTLTLARDPIVWARNVVRQFEIIVHPENLWKILSDPARMASRAERIGVGGTSMAFEYFEARRGFEKVITKVPVIGKPIAKAYEIAELVYYGFNELSKDGLWQAFKKDGMDIATKMDLARSIDRMTGTMSTAALGVSKTQRDVESAFVFFAPRYTRAGLSYVADVFRGGISGQQARTSLGALMATGVTTYYGACKLLGQTPNLDPSSAKFLTVKIGNDHIGIGGIFYGLARFATHVAATAADQPVNFLATNRFDNPFLRFMFQRSAPLTGLTFGLAIEHKDYFGVPFESPQDYAKFLLEKVTPIAMQRTIFEPKTANLPVFLSELTGLRTFPKSAFELQQETKDNLAMQNHGMTYKDLNRYQQREIDKQPSVILFQDEIDKQTTQRGKALSVEFLKWTQEREDARLMYEQDLNQFQTGVNKGLLTTYEFRENMRLAKAGYGKTLEHINSNPAYKPVFDKLAEPKEINTEFIGDVAYEELQTLINGTTLEDEAGQFDFKKYDQIRNAIQVKYGATVWKYILDREAQVRANEPPLAKEWYIAKDVLKPYWEVKDKIIAQYGKPKTPEQEDRINKLVTQEHRRLKLTNPRIAYYLNLFYNRTPEQLVQRQATPIDVTKLM